MKQVEKSKIVKWMACACIALPAMSLVSCSSDDDEESINTSPITVYAGSTYNIEGDVNSAVSSNEFVALVEKKTVTGNHVGEATITVNSKHKIPVTVRPKYMIMDDPVTDWGASKATIKQKHKQGTLKQETSDMLAYEKCGDADMVAYSFKNSKLAGIVVMVSMSKMDAYINYLKERFAFLPEQYENYTFLGFDAYTLAQSTTVAALSIYNTNYLSCVYMPTADFKSGAKAPKINVQEKLGIPSDMKATRELTFQLSDAIGISK